MRLRTVPLGVFLLLAGAPLLAEDVGQTVLVRNRVTARLDRGAGEERNLRDNDPVERNLLVQTGRSSALWMSFRSFPASCELGEASEALFDEDTTAQAAKATVNLPIGALRCAQGRRHPDRTSEALEIRTPDLIAKPKGTILRVVVTEAGTFVFVDEGSAEVTAKAGGRPVEVAAGHQVFVARGGGTPIVPIPAVGAGGGMAWGFSADVPLLDSLNLTIDAFKPPC